MQTTDMGSRSGAPSGVRRLVTITTLYLRTDVLVLAAVFESFRSVSMQHYGLDPAHYFSAPGMSWDALRKKTNVELELLTYSWLKGLRGGGVRQGQQPTMSGL